jgi:hypothetical protein
MINQKIQIILNKYFEKTENDDYIHPAIFGGGYGECSWKYDSKINTLYKLWWPGSYSRKCLLIKKTWADFYEEKKDYEERQNRKKEEEEEAINALSK